MFCPKCGSTVPDGVKFCTSCGNKLENQETSNVSSNNKSKKGGIGKLIIPILGIVVLVGIGFLVMNLLGGGGLKGQINKAKEISKFIDEDITVDDFDKKVGIVKFGKYPQESKKKDEKSDIEWIVLENDKENHKALLLSKYILDCKCYNNEYVDITWENCSLRKWLNDDFLDEAFTEKEQKKILKTTLKNADNKDYGTLGGEDTKDKIFCLSIDECKEYFGSKVNENYPPNDLLATKGTKYAKNVDNNGYNLYVKNKGNSFFWLRSPGYGQSLASIVGDRGAVNRYGDTVDYSEDGVRPALWVEY